MTDFLNSDKLTTSNELLITSLTKFYNKNNISILRNIIEGETIPLRIIDWYVTNYSKKHNEEIIIEKNNNKIYFNVYKEYKLQLKSYTKQYFDPFRRREKIKFFYDKEQFIVTTIGQLNFFRWCIENDILNHIYRIYKEIEEDMIVSQRENSLRKHIEKNKNDTNIKNRRKRYVEKKQDFNISQGTRVLSFD